MTNRAKYDALWQRYIRLNLRQQSDMFSRFMGRICDMSRHSRARWVATLLYNIEQSLNETESTHDH